MVVTAELSRPGLFSPEKSSLATISKNSELIHGPFTIKDRLAEELAAATPLPAHRFDPCVIRPAVVVDKYQTITFDGNRYSVPRAFAFQMVAVHGYVDRVVITAHGQIVATHTRCLRKHEMILDPIHYLAALGRKPGALDHSPVFRDWKLPACFADFRTELERIHGAIGGSRRFAQILQLMGEHPMSRVSQAIEACQRDLLHSAEAVIQRTQSLAAIEASETKNCCEIRGRDHIASSRCPTSRPHLLQPTSGPPCRRQPRQCFLRLIRFPEPRFGKESVNG